MSYARLLEIWERELGEAGSGYVPLVPLTLREQSVVFVGLNPSFSAPAITRLLPDLNANPEDYFAWANRSKFDCDVDRQLHERAKLGYPYFKKFKDIASALALDWDHQDMFFWRETSQSSFRERILVGNSASALTPFGAAQFVVAMDIIAASRPLAVVVANALASDIYLAQRLPGFNADLGCYEDVIGGATVPVFLSSMLTGQRALDRHSVRRLVWNLAFALGRDTGLTDF